MLVLLLFGCTKSSIIGRYVAKDSDTFIQVYFDFKGDSLLRVTHWSDMLGEFEETGYWFVRNDTIFTPNKIEESEISTIRFKKNNNVANFRINLFDEYNNMAIEIGEVVVNNTKINQSDSEFGVYNVELDKSRIEEIKVNYLSKTIKVPVNKLENFNEVTISFDFSKSRNDYIYSQAWLKRGNNLIPLDSGKSTLKKIK